LTREDFKQCFDLYFDVIRNYVYYRSGNADVASDIAQDVFLKLWEKQIDFEGARTKSLLYKMASDAFVSYLRKNNSAQNYVRSIPLHWDDRDPQKTLQHQELSKRYEQTLAALPENMRSVFLMNRVDEMTYKEIADCLKLSVKAVEKRMSATIKILKKALI